MKHMPHGNIHQRDEQRHAPHQPGLHACQLFGGRIHDLRLGLLGGRFLLWQAGSIASIHYRLYNLLIR